MISFCLIDDLPSCWARKFSNPNRLQTTQITNHNVFFQPGWAACFSLLIEHRSSELRTTRLWIGIQSCNCQHRQGICRYMEEENVFEKKKPKQNNIKFVSRPAISFPAWFQRFLFHRILFCTDSFLLLQGDPPQLWKSIYKFLEYGA